MRPPLCCAPLFLLLLLHLSFARPLFPLPSKTKNEEKKPIQTFRPYNIAHRGSNGEIPEETAAAYLKAIGEGADFIESDILASKDGALICFHDVTLDDTTDVARRKEFANRRRTYEVEWFNVSGWFVVDFTLEELKTLKVKQRYSFRDQQYNGMFSIITFEEFISIALDADRTVGIYPEIKDPVFINKHVKWADGKKFEDKFVDTLLKYGYKGEYMSENWMKQPLFIQSFAPTSIVHVSDLIDSPKVFLIDDITVRTQDTNQSYWEITSDDYLAYIAKYVVGLGPWKDTIVPASGNYLMPPSDLVARAHAHNLQRHPNPGTERGDTAAPHLRRREMATVPGDLIWQVVRKNNSFLVKQFGNGNAKVQFTKEPNNLYNVHSYKHSGLANKKTVTIQPAAGKDSAVVLSTTKTKKQNTPAKLSHKSVMRKEFRKMAKAVKNQVSDNYYRPDLTKPALARLSSVYRSLQVAKSGVKKKNRQPKH